MMKSVAIVTLLGLLAPLARADELATLKSQMAELLVANTQLQQRVAALDQRLHEMETQRGATAAVAMATVATNETMPDRTGSAVVTEAVVGGSEPGTFRLPGSKTELGLYGFVHVDAYVDGGSRQFVDWAADIGSQPVAGVPGNDGRHGKLNFTARTSRIGLKTATETELGALRTVVEADFHKNPNGSDGVQGNTLITNDYAFGLRHAYGELSGRLGQLLVGQTWSTFVYGDAVPETIDFNGSASSAFVRQPMIRYTLPLGGVGELALAAENPHGALDGTAAQELPFIDRLPDFIASWSLATDSAGISVQALKTEYRYDDASTRAHTDGYGLGLGGYLTPTEHDRLTFQYTTGLGLGRYLPATSWHIAFYDAATNKIRLYRSHSYLISWNRSWSERLRTNLAFGETYVEHNRDSDFSDGYIDSRRLTDLFANVILRLTDQVEWGLEYSYGERRTYPWLLGPGATGAAYTAVRRRYQTSLHFSF